MSNTIQTLPQTTSSTAECLSTAEMSLLVRLLKLTRTQHELIATALPALQQLQSSLAEQAEATTQQAAILRLVEETLLARYPTIQDFELKQQIFEWFNS
ncbi:hypothetical protein [Mannheimia indoligenes]|uniref:hypothetical protein n=1 Tax=Mannheimia indoligenes TaxID=3103145 RepID=UPI002FE60AAB